MRTGAFIGYRQSNELFALRQIQTHLLDCLKYFAHVCWGKYLQALGAGEGSDVVKTGKSRKAERLQEKHGTTGLRSSPCFFRGSERFSVKNHFRNPDDSSLRVKHMVGVCVCKREREECGVGRGGVCARLCLLWVWPSQAVRSPADPGEQAARCALEAEPQRRQGGGKKSGSRGSLRASAAQSRAPCTSGIRWGPPSVRS